MKPGVIGWACHSPKLSRSVTTVFFDGMARALENDESIEIRGFETFSVKKDKGYTAKNPRTGWVITVEPKKLPTLKCAKELKERVDIYKGKPKEEMNEAAKK